MRRLLWPAIVALGAGSASATAADIAGSWESNQGPITITKSKDGTYAVDFSLIKGKVAGALDGEVFQGTWVRANAGERCMSEKDGSPYWGGFRVTFYKPEIFQGYWYNCTHELKSGMSVQNWTGQLKE
jgi:hypothetical protein